MLKMTNEEIWEAQQGNSEWDDVEKGLAVARAAEEKRGKAIYEWGNEVCPHNNTQYKHHCSYCWAELKKLLKSNPLERKE